MSELKTKPSKKSVRSFLNSIAHQNRKEDCLKLLPLMESASRKKARMWGENIVGFGEYRYRYASGHSGNWMLTGFSPRKRNLVIYIMPGFSHYTELLQDLGKYKVGKSCLYVNRLDDLDLKVLKKLVSQSVRRMEKVYPCK